MGSVYHNLLQELRLEDKYKQGPLTRIVNNHVADTRKLISM